MAIQNGKYRENIVHGVRAWADYVRVLVKCGPQWPITNL